LPFSAPNSRTPRKKTENQKLKIVSSPRSDLLIMIIPTKAEWPGPLQRQKSHSDDTQ
jgi:hypothetical protein